jgi:hypothetical protein
MISLWEDEAGLAIGLRRAMTETLQNAGYCASVSHQLQHSRFQFLCPITGCTCEGDLAYLCEEYGCARKGGLSPHSDENF